MPCLGGIDCFSKVFIRFLALGVFWILLILYTSLCESFSGALLSLSDAASYSILMTLNKWYTQYHVLRLYNCSLVPRLPDLSSCFSVCNIEKLGIGPGNEASTTVQGYEITIHVHLYIQCHVSIFPHPQAKGKACVGRAWFRRSLHEPSSWQSFLSCLVPVSKHYGTIYYPLSLLEKSTDYMYQYIPVHSCTA